MEANAWLSIGTRDATILQEESRTPSPVPSPELESFSSVRTVLSEPIIDDDLEEVEMTPDVANGESVLPTKKEPELVKVDYPLEAIAEPPPEPEPDSWDAIPRVTSVKKAKGKKGSRLLRYSPPPPCPEPGYDFKDFDA